MTTEEAVTTLKKVESQTINYVVQTALNKAIQALEKEDALDDIISEVREWYWNADKQELAKDPCVVDAMVSMFIDTVKRHKGE